MKSETDPITDDEWLLRRVYKDRFRSEKAPFVSPNAFEPRIKGQCPDTDGISLCRAECLTDPAEMLAPIPADRRHETGIVRISAAFVKSLGLSVQPRPVDWIRGHVVIPELNATAYKANKAQFTPIKERLASEASKEQNILKRPGGASG